MAIVNYKNSPSEETPLTGGANGNLNVMQENGTSHGSDTKLGYSQTFLNDHIANISNEVDEDYRINFIKGKNLFDKNNYNSISGYIGPTVQIITQTGSGVKILYIPCKPNTTYTIQKIASKRFALGTTRITPAVGVNYYDLVSGGTSTTELSITTESQAKYLIVEYYIGASTSPDTLTEQEIVDTIMINEGNTPLPYEPYVVPSIYVDNEEIYSKPVVLWKNPSPTSSFASQTINLNEDASNYKFLEIYCKNRNDVNELMSCKIPVGTAGFNLMISPAGTSFRVFARLFNNTTTDKVGIGDCIFAFDLNSDTTTNNNYAIPIQVLGYK